MAKSKPAFCFFSDMHTSLLFLTRLYYHKSYLFKKPIEEVIAFIISLSQALEKLNLHHLMHFLHTLAN